MDDLYTGVRIETIKNEEEYKRKIHHNYRKSLNQNLKDKKVRYFYYDKNTNLWKYIKEKNSNICNNKLNETNKIFKEKFEKRKELNKKTFHNKRTRILAEGILYFSNGINEDFKNDKKGFLSKIDEFKNRFQKKYNSEILDFVLHLDENGNFHCHFIFENFNNKTKETLNFTKNKENGGELQDLRGNVFEDFGKGYKRGIKKDKTSRHLTIKEYQEYQETLKKNKELKKENEELIKLNIDIEDGFKELKIQFLKIYQDLLKINQIENRQDFLSKMQRYIKNDNKKRIDGILKKYEKLYQKSLKENEKRIKEQEEDYKKLQEIRKKEVEKQKNQNGITKQKPNEDEDTGWK